MKKIYVVENQKNESVWTGGNRSVVGVVLDEESKTIKLNKIKGIDVTLDGFLLILKEMMEELSTTLKFVKPTPKVLCLLFPITTVSLSLLHIIFLII